MTIDLSARSSLERGSLHSINGIAVHRVAASRSSELSFRLQARSKRLRLRHKVAGGKSFRDFDRGFQRADRRNDPELWRSSFRSREKGS